MHKKLQKQLNQATLRSKQASEVFESMKKTLISQNDEIAKAIDEADTEIIRLNEFKEGALSQHKENSRLLDGIAEITGAN